MVSKNGPSTTSGVARHGNISITFELITPEVAAKYLSQNRRNRKMIDTLSERYGVAMVNKQWVVTHEGIAFDEDGNLCDGQHRLKGVVKSGESVWFAVTRGLPLNAIEVVNRGKNRSLAHALQIMGYEYANQRTVSVARRMFFGPYTRNKNVVVSDVSLREFIDLNLEALSFVSKYFPNSRGPASVAGVIGRAYYHADHDRLARFGLAMNDLISKEEIVDGDRSARRLRIVMGSAEHFAGEGGQLMMYRKTQSALYAYLSGKDLTAIHETMNDIFPLPADRMVEIRELEKE